MIVGTNQNQTFNLKKKKKKKKHNLKKKKKKKKKKRNFVWRSTHIYKRVFVKNERGNGT